jgi:hypothetical protein
MLLELKTALLSRREVLLALTESSEGRMHEEAMILLQVRFRLLLSVYSHRS